jgi:hypothetical protein
MAIECSATGESHGILQESGLSPSCDDAGESGAIRKIRERLIPNVIVSAFGPEGPLKCSGLEVVRYDTESLHAEFGPRFHLIGSSTELHQTPFGTTQQFLYCYCVVE